MEPTALSQFYDDLKSRMDQPGPDPQDKLTRMQSNPAGGIDSSPAGAWRMKAIHNRDKLVDDCRKHMIVDVYCHICPLDKPYIDGHMGQMKRDVDSMLAGKGMSPTEYMTSACEKTKAPLLEYLLWATDSIGRQYMEEADQKLKDAKEKEIDLPEPEEVNVDDKQVEDQLVDIKSDSEYENFMDKLKEKTVKKIVADVSKLITDKKEEQSMEFNPAGSQEKLAAEGDAPVEESVVGACMDYPMKGIGPMMESVEDPDQLMGLAIREATLNELDRCFQMEGSDLIHSKRRIALGKGYIVNEAATRACVGDCAEEKKSEDSKKPENKKWTPRKK